MELPFLDLLAALFFLLALVVVARFREDIRIHDAESYRFLTAGLAVLSVVVLTRMFGGVGLFATVPLLSDPLFFKIVTWIGIIMGATFVVSGVSTWLPIARVNRRLGQDSMQRLELIKRVEQLVMVESRSPEVLCTALDYMVELAGVSWGAVYSCSTDDAHANLLSTSGGAASDVGALHQVEWTQDDVLGNDDLELSDRPNLARKLASLMPPPNLVLPLISGDRVYGAFLLWSGVEGALEENELRMNLKLAVDIITRQLDLDLQRSETAFAHRCRRFAQSLDEAMDPSLELKENFTAFVRLMSSQLQADHVSFAISSGGGLVRRLTIGTGGTLLDEVGLDLQVQASAIGQVFESGEPIFIGDSNEASALAQSGLAATGGIHSVLAIPVSRRGRRQAVLSIGSREAHAFDKRHQQLLQSVAPVFSDLIVADEHSQTLNEMRRRSSIVDSFLNELGATEDLQTAFCQAADLILAELKCSMVRIATYNHDGVFLRSRAVAHEKKVCPTTPPEGHMVMSLMPLHRQVRDQGKILLIGSDQAQTFTDAEESQAFFGEVQSALLVPITVGNQVLAVIGVGSADKEVRCGYRRADILLTRSIAGALSLAIRAELNRGATRPRDESDRLRTSSSTSRLRGQVKSSLSGILGSLEMIKAQHESSGPQLDKYLSIIDKSAHRIHEHVTQTTAE